MSMGYIQVCSHVVVVVVVVDDSWKQTPKVVNEKVCVITFSGPFLTPSLG